MNIAALSSILTGILALAAIASAGAQDHSHHEHAATVTPADAPAQRWATDAPLRKGMTDIRAAVEALGHDEADRKSQKDVQAQAARIDHSISHIVANCKLDSQADAALHGIIAKLAQGTAALKADPNDMAAITTLRSALRDYPRLFDDPGWSAYEAAR